MRLASFFILSVSLHAAALVYPLSFVGRSQPQLIQVTILPLEQEGSGTGGQGGGGIPARQGDSKSHRARSSAVEPRIEPPSPANPEPDVSPANNVATANNSSIALASAMENSTDSLSSPIFNATGNDAEGSAIGLGGTINGDGLGSSGTGFGRGIGNGSGSGISGVGIAVTQARYRDTPRPDYPESARREGREGRVLLRVLVDDQGRSKKVEINTSSGSEALDRAAAEAIRKWRFIPARYANQAVDSWLRIPIEFRLADATRW
jgi:periplasmic protein TonB